RPVTRSTRAAEDSVPVPSPPRSSRSILLSRSTFRFSTFPLFWLVSVPRRERNTADAIRHVRADRAERRRGAAGAGRSFGSAAGGRGVPPGPDPGGARAQRAAGDALRGRGAARVRGRSRRAAAGPSRVDVPARVLGAPAAKHVVPRAVREQ